MEGYIESASSGLVAGINAARLAKGKETLIFPPETACGALAEYIATASPENFQPMNVNFGLFPPFVERVRKSDRKLKYGERALNKINDMTEDKKES